LLKGTVGPFDISTETVFDDDVLDADTGSDSVGESGRAGMDGEVDDEEEDDEGVVAHEWDFDSDLHSPAQLFVHLLGLRLLAMNASALLPFPHAVCVSVAPVAVRCPCPLCPFNGQTVDGDELVIIDGSCERRRQEV